MLPAAYVEYNLFKYGLGLFIKSHKGEDGEEGGEGNNKVKMLAAFITGVITQSSVEFVFYHQAEKSHELNTNAKLVGEAEDIE